MDEKKNYNYKALPTGNYSLRMLDYDVLDNDDRTVKMIFEVVKGRYVGVHLNGSFHRSSLKSLYVFSKMMTDNQVNHVTGLFDKTIRVQVTQMMNENQDKVYGYITRWLPYSGEPGEEKPKTKTKKKKAKSVLTPEFATARFDHLTRGGM